jgi:acetyl-CoA carboxylase biotin carboxyl carrier protein
MEIKDLEQIIKILRDSDVAELEFEQGGTKVRLTRGSIANGSVAVQPVEVRPLAASAPRAAAEVATAAPAFDSNLTRVESPIVGTFYRKPSPDAEAFVSEGAMVKKGATLCIIEAMKVMNEIEAPCSGKVEKCFLQDGKVVEYGELLFLINPNA